MVPRLGCKPDGLIGMLEVFYLFVFNVMCVSKGVLAFSSKELMPDMAAKRSRSTTVDPEFEFFLLAAESLALLERIMPVRLGSKCRNLTVGISSDVCRFCRTATLRIFILPRFGYGTMVLVASRIGAVLLNSGSLGTALSLMAGSLAFYIDCCERSLNLAIRAFNTSSFGPLILGSDWCKAPRMMIGWRPCGVFVRSILRENFSGVIN